METVDGTEWDVVISGTGLRQSLLALALSRSGQKVLHVDKNDYYGGNEAAFSLQEAEDWVRKINEEPNAFPFQDARIRSQPTTDQNDPSAPKLSFSRAYTLALSPQVIYTQSKILPILVSSKVYRQLDFQAIGHWWVYSRELAASSGDGSKDVEQPTSKRRRGNFYCVPNGREDVFSDESLDMKSRRALMKFLKSTALGEEPIDEDLEGLFPDLLSLRYRLPAYLQNSLFALTLSPNSPSHIQNKYALPRIRRHLRSIGVFGPGFGAVTPKWGGTAEIAQVACRAGAVGGGVYVLNRRIAKIDEINIDGVPDQAQAATLKGVKLSNGEAVKTRWVVGTNHDLPTTSDLKLQQSLKASRSISILSTDLSELLPVTAEGAPPPVGAVIVLPSGSLSKEDQPGECPPVYVIVHSSDTGECPVGQSVLYAYTLANGQKGQDLLLDAVNTIISNLQMTPLPQVLWSLQYTQTFRHSESDPALQPNIDSNILLFPELELDLSLEDDVVDQVREVWHRIQPGADETEFMRFEERGEDGQENTDE
ncbi:MAG: Rab proteins geranylgeranyltransferase component A [Cirrosporium novae-zelandiae]|nr:MAG: Rab proteins geranylgeranyltransferase component A [Cirrosporium novae-zelandiae]